MGKISLIVAHDRARGIGRDNKLVWNLPNDMKHFQRVTMGNIVVMGRKTFESIGKPLRGRRNVVLSTTLQKQHKVHVERDFKTLLEKLHKISRPAFIIGGAEIYKLFLPYADEVLVTEVDGNFECDTFFPVLSQSNWKLVENIEGTVDEKNIPHYFLKFERRM
ncbi:dihydrofolate reductase [Neobacillus rhizosphaerae]|uniref:dihydrofolate reductase n=1 Tax=Neobacillus rhizosphaerae TaxID=2880965 RepID=UPI003D2BE67C